MTLPDVCTLHLYCIHMVISTSLICISNLMAKREHFDHIIFYFGSKEIFLKSVWFWFKRNTEKNCFLNLPIFCFCDKPKPKSKGSSTLTDIEAIPPFCRDLLVWALFQVPNLTISSKNQTLHVPLLTSSSSSLSLALKCHELGHASDAICCNSQYTLQHHSGRIVFLNSLQTQKLFWFSVLHRTKWSCKTVFFPPFFVCFWAGLLTGGWSQIRPTKCNNTAHNIDVHKTYC